MKVKIISIGIIVLLFIGGGTYFFTRQPSRGPGGSVYPETTPVTGGYGFAGSFKDLSTTQIDARLSAMRTAHATWMRLDVSWNEVQSKGPSDYNWSRYDKIVRAAQTHNVNVLVIIDLTPAWARKNGCNSELCSPKEPKIYGEFAGAVAQHFAPAGVHTFEVWNEPNIDFRFRPVANVGQYSAMLKEAYLAIKRIDPKATVVAASVAPSRTDKSNYSPSDFLKGMYGSGAGGYFDAISAHPYIYPILPKKSSPYDAWGQLPAMHDFMAAHEDGNKQIWITEFGAPTNGPSKPGEYISEAEQAQTATQAIEIFRNYTWAGPFFWYDYIDAGTDKSTSEDFYGLLRADGSSKPAYDAWLKAVQ